MAWKILFLCVCVYLCLFLSLSLPPWCLPLSPPLLAAATADEGHFFFHPYYYYSYEKRIALIHFRESRPENVAAVVGASFLLLLFLPVWKWGREGGKNRPGFAFLFFYVVFPTAWRLCVAQLSSWLQTWCNNNLSFFCQFEGKRQGGHVRRFIAISTTYVQMAI